MGDVVKGRIHKKEKRKEEREYGIMNIEQRILK
jgi:hypothetical protein